MSNIFRHEFFTVPMEVVDRRWDPNGSALIVLLRLCAEANRHTAPALTFPLVEIARLTELHSETVTLAVRKLEAAKLVIREERKDATGKKYTAVVLLQDGQPATAPAGYCGEYPKRQTKRSSTITQQPPHEKSVSTVPGQHGKSAPRHTDNPCAPHGNSVCPALEAVESALLTNPGPSEKTLKKILSEKKEVHSFKGLEESSVPSTKTTVLKSPGWSELTPYRTPKKIAAPDTPTKLPFEHELSTADRARMARRFQKKTMTLQTGRRESNEKGEPIGPKEREDRR